VLAVSSDAAVSSSIIADMMAFLPKDAFFLSLVKFIFASTDHVHLPSISATRHIISALLLHDSDFAVAVCSRLSGLISVLTVATPSRSSTLPHLAPPIDRFYPAAVFQTTMRTSSGAQPFVCSWTMQALWSHMKILRSVPNCSIYLVPCLNRWPRSRWAVMQIVKMTMMMMAIACLVVVIGVVTPGIAAKKAPGMIGLFFTDFNLHFSGDRGQPVVALPPKRHSPWRMYRLCSLLQECEVLILTRPFTRESRAHCNLQASFFWVAFVHKLSPLNLWPYHHHHHCPIRFIGRIYAASRKSSPAPSVLPVQKAKYDWVLILYLAPYSAFWTPCNRSWIP
jgi:hypothetical protein